MTNTQQLTALLTALRGRAVRSETVSRVANAVAGAYRPNDNLTSDERAGLVVRLVTSHLLEIVNNHERQALERAARAAHTPLDISEL